jgi:Flp pilus assembly pilin Flp
MPDTAPSQEQDRHPSAHSAPPAPPGSAPGLLLVADEAALRTTLSPEDLPPGSRPEGAAPVARFTAFCRQLWTREEGATAHEYALLLALLTALCLITAASLGAHVNDLFLRVGGSLPDGAGVPGGGVAGKVAPAPPVRPGENLSDPPRDTGPPSWDLGPTAGSSGEPGAGTRKRSSALRLFTAVLVLAGLLGGAAYLYGKVRRSPRKAFEQLARRVQARLRGYQYEVKEGGFVLARYRCAPDASVSYAVLEVRSPLSPHLGLLRFEMVESGGAGRSARQFLAEYRYQGGGWVFKGCEHGPVEVRGDADQGGGKSVEPLPHGKLPLTDAGLIALLTGQD